MMFVTIFALVTFEVDLVEVLKNQDVEITQNERFCTLLFGWDLKKKSVRSDLGPSQGKFSSNA